MTADLAQISRARVRAAEALVATARHHQRQLQALAAGLPPALQLELALLAEVGLHEGPPWTSPSALPAAWGLGAAAASPPAWGADPDLGGAAGGVIDPPASAPIVAGDARAADEGPGGSAEGEGAAAAAPGPALPTGDPDAPSTAAGIAAALVGGAAAGVLGALADADAAPVEVAQDADADAAPVDAAQDADADAAPVEPAQGAEAEAAPEDQAAPLEPELELIYDSDADQELDAAPEIEPDLELIYDHASAAGAGEDPAPAADEAGPPRADAGPVHEDSAPDAAPDGDDQEAASPEAPALERIDAQPADGAAAGPELEPAAAPTDDEAPGPSPDAVFARPGEDEAETAAQPPGGAGPSTLADDTQELEAEQADAHDDLGPAVVEALRRGAPDAALEQRTSEIEGSDEDDAAEVLLDEEPAEAGPEDEDLDPDDVFAGDLDPSDTDTSRSTLANPAIGLAALRIGPAAPDIEPDSGALAPDAAFSAGGAPSPFFDDPDEEHTLIDAGLGGGAPSPWLPAASADAEEEATAQLRPTRAAEPTTDPDQRTSSPYGGTTASLRMPTLAAPRALGLALSAPTPASEAPTTSAAVRAELEQGTGAHAHARTRPLELRSGPTAALRKPDPWAPAGPRVVEGDSAPVEPLGAAAIQILGIGKARTLTQTLELDGGMEEPPEEMLSANIQAVKPHEDDDPDGDLAVRFEEPAEDSGPRVPRLTEAPPTPTHSPSVLTAEGILSTVAPPDLRSDLGNSELQRIVREAEESERRGKLREAVTFYGDALEHDPELVPAWLGRGRCLVELSDYGAAMSDFSRAEDLAPESPAPAIEMGNLFFVRKEYAKAISHFDQALQLQPQHALALARRGTAHLHRKDQAAALADLQRAYKLDPNIPGLQRQLQAAQKKPAR